MTTRAWSRATALLLFWIVTVPLFGSTWFVRPDGGTRYSAGMPKGQCDGKADTAYPGKGTNQHCAFNDVRFFWQDGSPSTGATFPSWGWIGSGGDTYLIRGSITDGVSYRVGWPTNTASCSQGLCFGIQGDPYGSGAPLPPSGTAATHTRILGGNYAACHTAGAKAQLHGGFGVLTVLNMSGASYVDVGCVDITDFSSCGRAAQTNACNTSVGSLSDYATNGITWSNKSTNDTLTDVHVHGLSGAGMIGPTGTGMVFNYLDLVGNASSGWNADVGNGTTGTGTLTVQHYNISWNGCAEEYPLHDATPYQDCTDDNSGGYGDGFGTTTASSNPAWNVTFDQGEVFNNTQDGLDALHIDGAGSSMTVTHTLAYGNMGQQIKVGGASATVTDNKIVANCNALRQPIPGTPAGFNKRLSDFCRAADVGILVNVNNTVPLRFDSNIIYSANATALEIECASEPCGASARVDFRNNIFIGFRNDAQSGYSSGGGGDFPNPIYLGSGTDPFRNAGSVYSDNTTFHPGHGWKCPAHNETKALCGDPHLKDETWHLYGYGSMDRPDSGRAQDHSSISGGASHSDPVSYFHGHAGKAALACLSAGVVVTAAWKRARQTKPGQS